MALTKNFAKTTASIGYNSSATSITLQTNDGAKLPTTTPFFLTWWDETNYPDPSDDPNVEIVLVTAVATDTLTVTRGQQSTAATSKNTGGATYRLALNPTAYDFGYLPLVSSSSDIIYVDANNGEDSTAQRGNPFRPYQTFATAWAKITSGDTLIINPGTYTITPVTGSNSSTDNAPFKIASLTNVTIKGVGFPVIYGAGDGCWFSIYNSSDIHIEGIIFRGDGTHTVASTANPIFAMWDIRPTATTSDVSWVNCRFEDYRNHAIAGLFAPKPHSRLKVLGCHFQGGGQFVIGTANSDGAAVVSLGSDVLVSGCTFQNILRGIELEGEGPHRGVTITNNTFTNIWEFGIMTFAGFGDETHFSRVTITGNTFRSVLASNAPAAFSGDASAFIMTGGTEYVIGSNVFENCKNGIVGNATAADIFHINVHGNIFQTVQLPIQFFASEADVTAGRRVEQINVTGNTSWAGNGSGMRFRGQNIQVVGNIINGHNDEGILLLNSGTTAVNPSYIVIRSNQIGNGPLSGFCDYGVEIQSNFHGVLVTDNDIRNINTSALNDLGTGTVNRNNDI